MEDLLKSLAAGERRIVVVDVEATCWKKGVFSRKKETIEIGAVLLQLDPARARAPATAKAKARAKATPKARAGSEEWPEFQTFVRPLKLPRLSSFCRELTGISQEDVDAAPSFPEALRLFLKWAEPLDRVVLASWSHYDVWQLDLDLENHELPKLAFPFLDVKKLAAQIIGARNFEETARRFAPDCIDMPRHRAIADAHRTARILRLVMAR